MGEFYHETFFRLLSLISPMDPEEEEAIRRAITVVHLSKGDFWVKEGEKACQLGFVEKGYLRKYYVRDSKEVTDYFYFEQSFTGDLPGIINHQPSLSNVVAMEPTQVLALPYDTMNGLCKKHHDIEHIMRVMSEKVLSTFYYRCVSFIRSSPRERYQQLIYEQPEVWQRAAHQHIASFLGISPQHLARLSASM